MRTAKKSICGEYPCKKNWPEDAYLQCGEKGVVFSKNGNYATAFFEAFPKNPETFIRGEGKDLEEAESNAYKKYLNIMNCENHEMVRRGNSESGKCTKCNLSLSNFFPPLGKCDVCGKEHVNLSLYDDKTKSFKNLCIEHYLQKMDELSDFFSTKNLDYFIKDEFNDSWNVDKLSLIDLEMCLKIKIKQKWDLLQNKENEYKDVQTINDEFVLIFSKINNEINTVIKNSEVYSVYFKDFRIPSIIHFTVLYQELYEKLLEKYYGLSNEDLTNDILLVLNKYKESLENSDEFKKQLSRESI